MEIQDYFGADRSIAEVIDDLKHLKDPLGIPSWESRLKLEYYTKYHRIKTDQEFWADKGTKKKPRKVSRITYGLQKLATGRMTQMAFAIPVRRIYDYNKKDKTQKEIVSAIESIYKRIHIDSLNRKRMKMYFAACELLTIWYAVEGQEEHEDYKFKTKYKLRCKSYSPKNGYGLYPILDEYDDMLGMCIEYKEKKYKNGSHHELTHFEMFLPGRHVKYTHDGKDWGKSIDEPVKIVKLPLAYMYREQPIWEDQTGNCDEIELAMSRESEILRHNSAPYLQVSGQLVSKDKPAAAGAPATVKKVKDNEDNTDDATRMVRLENGGEVKYVTWEQSVEAMKYFISELKKNSDEELQLANLSLENVKGLGAMSGEARKTLLTDPHLKVGDESGEIIMFLEREWKVVCAFVGAMNPSWKDGIKKISCEHIVTPFIQGDENADIKKWREANGGEPLLSHRTSIKYSGLVDDPDAEYEEIVKEEADRTRRQSAVDIFGNEDDE